LNLLFFLQLLPTNLWIQIILVGTIFPDLLISEDMHSNMSGIINLTICSMFQNLLMICPNRQKNSNVYFAVVTN